MRETRAWTFLLLLIWLMVFVGIAGCRSTMPTATAVSSTVISNEPSKQLALTWKRELDEGCQTVMIDTQGQAIFGSCSNPSRVAPILREVERHQDLQYFLEHYQSFEADTSAGHIVFTGNGVQVATLSQQRAIAEWATIVHQELQFGRSGASWGLAVALNQEGSNPCSRIQIEVYGKVFANYCHIGIEPYPTVWLSPEQLDRLYSWLDSSDAIAINWNEDDLPMRFVFSGRGAQVAQDEDQRKILAWTVEIYESFAR